MRSQQQRLLAAVSDNNKDIPWLCIHDSLS
jgi:NADH dehydrogenase/NADH:ubiquinone oxidoreductase subunit G